MKAERLPNHIGHPLSGKTHRIPYVRTFAFLALIVILLVLAALGRAAPPKIDLTHAAELGDREEGAKEVEVHVVSWAAAPSNASGPPAEASLAQALTSRPVGRTTPIR